MKKTNSKPDRTRRKPLKILFADDEPKLQKLMQRELPRMGHEVTICPDGNVAAAVLEESAFDCVLVDIDMPGLSGIEVIEKTKQLAPETEAIVLTGKSSTETAIAALRHGAFDYLTKPCKLMELRALLMRVAEKRELTKKFTALKRQVQRVLGGTELVGSGAAMRQLRELIAKVAPTPSTVLILGETGSGKELVARAIHEQSTRFEMPFVAINCGALPEALIESELFGHRRGAFTGADEHRSGLFEVASGGTLFLDEIGELPLAMQAKLLRVLESGEIRRVGDNEPLKVDVRVVCATHRILEQMVEEGDFREDLMYRINPFEICVPPLRERREDIAELAAHLYQRFRAATPLSDPLFTPDALAMLESHTWPGNVRELANVIEHATIVSDQLPITPADLPNRFGARSARLIASGGMTLRELEHYAIHQSLKQHNGNKTAAAEALGISVKTLYNKLNPTDTLKRTA